MIESGHKTPRWHIAPTTSATARPLAECHIACWREAYRGLVPAHVLDAFDVDRRAGQWERILRAEPRHTYVATHEDEVIGFVRTERAREGTPVADTELSALYVRARWYGTGLADELIRAVLTPTNPYSLWVFQCNPRAVTFYRRHDFVADGHSRTDYFSGLTEIRMRRLLPD